MSARRVLVTGATGFLGRQTLRPLAERGFEVHGAGRSAADVDEELAGAVAAWHRADLLDAGQRRRLVDELAPSHLLHLAWHMDRAGDHLASLDNVAWIRATVDLLRAAREAGADRAVAVGSCFEYDPRYGFCSEQLTPTGDAPSMYGRAKDATRRLATLDADRTGLSLAWARVFFALGPHEPADRVVPYVVRCVLAGEVAACSHGRQIRDFLHARDIGDALAALVDAPVTGPVNVGSGSPIRLAELLRRAADLAGDASLLKLGAREPRADDPPLLVADVARLRDEVGWEPSMGIGQALADTVAWWRVQHGAAS